MNGSDTTATTDRPKRPTMPRWLSPERLSLGFGFVLLLHIEVIPIQAAALTLTGASDTPLDQAFGPFWLIALTLAAFAFVRWLLRNANPIALTVVGLLLGALALALFVALSPSGYGNTPGGLFSASWLLQLQQDAVADTTRFNGLFVMAPIVVYLGWRGMTLGGSPPRIEVVLRRFTISLAVVMAACVFALATPAAMQPQLQGALLTALAADVFAGLAEASLARRGGGRESAQLESGSEMTRWLLTALGAAALVVVVAFMIGLALNFSLISTLLRSLGPAGAVLNSAVLWLLEGFAYLLWILFVKTIGAWLFQNSAFYVSPPKSVGGGVSHAPKHLVLAQPPVGFFIAAGVIVGLVFVAVLLFILWAGVREMLKRMRAADPEVDEEREALDARSLFGKQARDLLESWRRGAGRAERDPLTAGTARWLYREALRAGAASGVPRRAGETADEYSRRLAGALRELGAQDELPALAAITQAYDEARYGEHDAPAPPELAALSRRVTTALGRLRG